MKGIVNQFSLGDTFDGRKMYEWEKVVYWTMLIEMDCVMHLEVGKHSTRVFRSISKSVTNLYDANKKRDKQIDEEKEDFHS